MAAVSSPYTIAGLAFHVSARSLLSNDLRKLNSNTPAANVAAYEIRRVRALNCEIAKLEAACRVKGGQELFPYAELLSPFVNPFEEGRVLPSFAENGDGAR